VFLEFANFYRRFVKYFAKITKFLIKLLKNNKQEKQNKLFLFNAFALIAFRTLINVFITIFILMYFDFKNRIIIKINVLKFIIAIFFLVCVLCAKRQLDDIIFCRILL